MFVWKLCHNLIPMKENLRRKRLTETGICPICNREAGTAEHALLYCQYWIRPVWFGLQLGLRADNYQALNFANWLEERIKEIEKLPNQKEYVFTSLCTALWGIWKTRNSLVFEGKSPNPEVTLAQITGQIQDYAPLIPPPKGGVRSQTMQVHPWRPPPTKIIKFNVDASFQKSSGHTSIAVAGRDCNGDLITGLTKKTFAGSPPVAEALAFREAISFAVNMNIRRVIIESDNLELVSVCRQEKEIGEIKAITRDISRLKEQFQTCGFTWIGKLGNSLAHTLAEMNARNSLPRNWRWNLPQSVQDIVFKEKRNYQAHKRGGDRFGNSRNTHRSETSVQYEEDPTLQWPTTSMGLMRAPPPSFPLDPGI